MTTTTLEKLLARPSYTWKHKTYTIVSYRVLDKYICELNNFFIKWMEVSSKLYEEKNESFIQTLESKRVKVRE